MTRHEIVTLASIIEAEVRYRPDRPYVSAVYHNRLKRGMALQADPTIIYAHGRRLRRAGEEQPHTRPPPNTQPKPPLPPGPPRHPTPPPPLAARSPPPTRPLSPLPQPRAEH